MHDLQNQQNASELSEFNDEPVTLRDQPGLLDVLGTNCMEGRYDTLNIEDCTGIPDERTVDVTGLPDYPGCTFTVTFQMITCKIGSLTDLIVSDYQIVSHDCQKFSDQIANGYFPDFQDHNDLREIFEIQMYEAIEDFVIAEELAEEGEGTYTCEVGRLFQITHYASSCYRYCYELYKYDEGVPLWNQIKIGGCGTECCEVHTRVCVNAEGGIEKETDYVECIGSECLHCQYDPLFWPYEIHPCEVPATLPNISIPDEGSGSGPGSTPTPPETTDCMFSCKTVD